MFWIIVALAAIGCIYSSIAFYKQDEEIENQKDCESWEKEINKFR